MDNVEQPWALAIDQGGHSTRATIISANGCIIAAGQIPLSPLPGDKHIEYDPEQMLVSILDAIAKVSRDIDVSRIKRAALATQRSNVLCWDRYSGTPLSPIISWQDRRAADWLCETKSQMAPEIHRQTGLFLSAHYGASKLHWCRKHLSTVADAARSGRLAWGPMSSWLVRQLCQEAPFVCDAVNASRTMLWSIADGNWSDELIHAFELDDGKLPNSVDSRYDFGTLNVSGHPIPLEVVTGDQAAALYARGQPDRDTAYVTIGTGAFILNPCGPTPGITDDLLSTLVWYTQGTPNFVHEGTINGAACALEYYAGQLGQTEYIEHMEQWLQHEPSPPLFLNGYAGLGTPFMRPDFESRFIGASDARGKLVAVIESIVFLLMINLQRMQEHNPALKQISIGGGLSRFDGLCQRLADLGLPVFRHEQTETTVSGLAWLLSQDTLTADRHTALSGTTFLPQDNPDLQQRFQRWQEALTAALAETLTNG